MPCCFKDDSFSPDDLRRICQVNVHMGVKKYLGRLKDGGGPDTFTSWPRGRNIQAQSGSVNTWFAESSGHVGVVVRGKVEAYCW